MKINIEYGMEVSEEMFSAMKEGVGVDTDEEFIGFLKCAVKAQSVTGCKTTNLRNGKEFKIALPCYKNANKENYKSLSYSIATVDGCVYTTVFSTMFLSELKDGVKKFLNGEI